MLLGKRSPWKNNFSPQKALDFFTKKFCMDNVNDQSFFSLVITFLLLVTFSIDDVEYQFRLEKMDVEHS